MYKKNTLSIKSDGNHFIKINCEETETILDAMIRHGIWYPTDCGGNGTCGKCKIQIFELQGKSNVDVSAMDQNIFTEEELAKGYRLACQAYLKEDATVIPLIKQEVEEFEVITDNKLSHGTEIQVVRDNEIPTESHYKIAIDLGTTTIAVRLFDTQKNEVCKTLTFVNHQKVYGADVIARIKASNEGKREHLKEIIREQILDGIFNVIAGLDVLSGNIDKIVIAGNTTMLHLFMGYCCETLGVYPFTPVHNDLIEQNFFDVFLEEELNSFLEKSELECDIKQGVLGMLMPAIVSLLPGISAFVGGDITAGLYACGFDQAKKPCMLIDLGTNGEMAIGNREHILVSSAAAGPAFEGGNLSCGIGSVPGAISHVNIIEDKLYYQTIGEKPPIGICGTGVIDLIAEILKAGIIDETGLLSGKYFDQGYSITDVFEDKDATVNPTEKLNVNSKIKLTQKDIREFQLAKAAIRAGIDILLKRYQINIEQLDMVYLAGGFGYKMDIEKAISIGLFPGEIKHKIQAVGNSSLAGAVRFANDDKAFDSMMHIISISDELHLAKDPDFNDLFIEYMSF